MSQDKIDSIVFQGDQEVYVKISVDTVENKTDVTNIINESALKKSLPSDWSSMMKFISSQNWKSAYIQLNDEDKEYKDENEDEDEEYKDEDEEDEDENEYEEDKDVDNTNAPKSGGSRRTTQSSGKGVYEKRTKQALYDLARSRKLPVKRTTKKADIITLLRKRK